MVEVHIYKIFLFLLNKTKTQLKYKYSIASISQLSGFLQRYKYFVVNSEFHIVSIIMNYNIAMKIEQIPDAPTTYEIYNLAQYYYAINPLKLV